MVAINEQKWRWAGHVARRDDNRWNKTLTDWTPREGKRDRRRPDRRWRDEMERTAGATWQQQLKSRKSWKGLGEAQGCIYLFNHLFIYLLFFLQTLHNHNQFNSLQQVSLVQALSVCLRGIRNTEHDRE